MNSRLIELLKEARLNSGLRQQDIAEKLGIKNNTLSNWERGRNEPDIDTFVKMCEIYGVDSIDLLRRAYDLTEQGITAHENKVVGAYRKNPDMQAAVDKLLNVEQGEGEKVKIFRAARSENNAEPQVMEVSRERLDKLKNASEVKEI